jgi:glycosyltransferase involved in cell wall biosynthesis
MILEHRALPRGLLSMMSVVIPAYNEQKYINRCLQSLKEQDYSGKYEIIVVDNGSSDNTQKIARSMGVRVISCPKKGVSYARQAGAEAARGLIIIQADADTIYPQWWLRRIKRQFDTHPKAVAVAGTFIYRNPPWWAAFEYFLRRVFGFLSAVLFGRPLIISGANFAFYKKSLEEIGGYKQDAYSSDQLDISARLSKKGKIYYDGRSYGATSSRAVAKPTFVVASEFFQHLYIFGRHTCKDLSGRLKKNNKIGDCKQAAE